MTPEEIAEEQRIRSFDIDPVCWSWPLPALVLVPPDQRAELMAWETLKRWQAGRCAICAEEAVLVRDHDHVTGLVRGWLCRSCNVRESSWRGESSIFGRYRSRPPTAILNLVLRYCDPVTGEPDMGRTPPDPANRWTNNAMGGVL